MACDYRAVPTFILKAPTHHHQHIGMDTATFWYLTFHFGILLLRFTEWLNPALMRRRKPYSMGDAHD